MRKAEDYHEKLYERCIKIHNSGEVYCKKAGVQIFEIGNNCEKDEDKCSKNAEKKENCNKSCIN